MGYPGGAGIGFFSPGAFLLFDALAVVFGFFGVLFGVVVFGFFGVVVFAGAFASSSVVACARATRGMERWLAPGTTTTTTTIDDERQILKT